jgi:hypothetical protein
MIFVRDVESSQNRQSHGVDGVGSFGDGANFCVYVLGEFQDVFGVGAAQIVGLIENFNPHAGVLWVPYQLVFGRCSHSLISGCERGVLG